MGAVSGVGVTMGDDGDDGDDVPPFDGRVSLSEKTLEEGEASSSSSPSSLLPRAWRRDPGGGPWWDADTGHRVLATRRGDGWVYFAFGPDRSAGWDYRAWRDGRAPHWSGQEPPVHYPRGVPIPQPRETLGLCATAEEARALCAADAAGPAKP